MALSDIVSRWVTEVVKDAPRYLMPRNANVIVHGGWGVKRARLYSYGTHFEMARYVDATDTHGAYWLLNGDTYSVSTTRHQSMVRDAVQRAARQRDEAVIILPHTPMKTAGIDLESIRPVEVTHDRMVPEIRHYTRATLPSYLVNLEDHPDDSTISLSGLTVHGDGTFSYATQRHVLGESAFQADVTAVTYVKADDGYSHPVYGTRAAYFLSAFDHQEPTRHYFLCELPAGVAPTSVAEAFETLKPAAVVAAEAAGSTVTRQGDVFAVPVPLTTREIRSAAVSVTRGSTRSSDAHLLGLSHVATESAVMSDGTTYARGTLTHRPFFGRPAEHKRQTMGDRKGWHMIVKNTVPLDARGESRAWSVVGNVD